MINSEKGRELIDRAFNDKKKKKNNFHITLVGIHFTFN